MQKGALSVSQPWYKYCGRRTFHHCQPLSGWISLFHKITTFMRQLIFDIIFLAENITITIIAIMNIPVKPFSDINEQSRLFAILFFIHFLGLILKIMYYKFFHIWKDITTRLDFDTRSFYRGDEELDYSCMCPTLNYDMCCCQK